MANNRDPAMSVVDIFLQLRLLQIWVGENSLTKHALRLLQILVFSDASEIKTNVVIISFPFLRHEGLC